MLKTQSMCMKVAALSYSLLQYYLHSNCVPQKYTQNTAHMKVAALSYSLLQY